MGKKKEPSDKGVFIWGFFTAIMIIVIFDIFSPFNFCLGSHPKQIADLRTLRAQKMPQDEELTELPIPDGR